MTWAQRKIVHWTSSFLNVPELLRRYVTDLMPGFLHQYPVRETVASNFRITTIQSSLCISEAQNSLLVHVIFYYLICGQHILVCTSFSIEHLQSSDKHTVYRICKIPDR